MRAARIWFALTAVGVLVGLVVQVRATAQVDEGFFDSDAKRIANIFCYFTIWSNILIGATSALLAVRLDRRSTAFRATYLAAVLMIVVTGIVVQVALKDIVAELDGKAAAADFFTHQLAPVMGGLGWILFGPRGWIDGRVIRGAVVIPVVWLAFTLIRAPFASDFYPYPFLDVTDLGYPRVFVNIAIVAVLFLGLAFGARALDPHLPDLAGTRADPAAHHALDSRS